MLGSIGTGLTPVQAIHIHARYGPLATSAPVSSAEASYIALSLWPSLAMFLLLNSHRSKQGSCSQIPHGECCVYSAKYSVMPGNCLQGPFKQSNDTDNQVPGLGSLPFTIMEMIIIFVPTTEASEESQHLVLRSCTWKQCQVLQGAFRQWWWQCLTEVTVVMPPASLASCVLQLWELKCGCPDMRVSKEALN